MALVLLVGIVGCADSDPEIQAMRQSVGPEPSFESIKSRADRYYSQGLYEEAATYYEWAVEQKPQNAQALMQLARSRSIVADRYFNQGEYVKAQREISLALVATRKGLAYHPGHMQLLTLHNECLARQGRYDDAVDAAQWAADYAGPTAGAQVVLGREHLRRGEYREAELAFSKAASLEPDNALPHLALGRLYARMDRTDDALRHLEIAYKLDPDLPGLRTEMEQMGYVPAAVGARNTTR